MLRALLAFFILLPAVSQARVFSFKETSIGAYVRGTGGLAPVNQDAFANSSGSATASMTGASKYDYSGEIGFIFGLGANVHFRLGAEVLAPSSVDSTGSNAAGAELFTLKSSVFVFNPNVAIEFVYGGSGSLRYYFYAGVGYATINVTNDYKITVPASFSGVTDFKETLVGTAISGSAGFGLETLFTDNVTFLTDFGYRYLPVSSLTYGSAVKNIVKPTGVSAGDDVLNSDGSKRTMSMSGLFGSVAFRFYFNFL